MIFNVLCAPKNGVDIRSMKLKSLHQIRRFRSQPARIDAGRIDAENGILYDVVMVEEGPAKGHGVNLDSEFISALVSYDQLNFGERGVKARLGHPGMCDNAQGAQLGFYRNVRKRNKGGKMQAIADLHLLQAADQSPKNPNARSWVIQMATESPDFIMSSIVFVGSGYYQKKANGHKKPVMTDEDYDSTQPLFVEFDAENGAAHYNTDLVEEGAATTHLFSTSANPHLLVSGIYEWLDDNPEVYAFAQQHPAEVAAMMSRLGIEVNKPNPAVTMSSFSISKWLFGQPQETAPTPEDLTSLREQLLAAQQAVASLSKEVETLRTSLLAAQQAQTFATAELEAAQTRIAELEAAPAAPPTGGDTPGAPAQGQTGTPLERKKMPGLK